MVARIGPKNRNRMRIFLRQWREHLGLTQEQVAERIGTTKGTVSRMEVTSREPNLGYLAAFAEAIDRDTADIFRDPAAPSHEELLQNASHSELHEALTLIRTIRRTGTNS